MRKKTYISKEVSVCKECAGEGSVVIAGEHLGHGRYSESKLETCGVCKGSGLVTVEKITTVTITPKKPMP
jgi:DnaJ-class molecular chaperone